MANFCLMPQQAQAFLDAVKNGDINPDQLSKLSSDERRAALAKFVGEGDAKAVNSLFESKLLLKNQQMGYTTWAKKVAGLTPAVRRDLLTRISRMDRVLNPQEEQQFLKDLAETKLGVGVSQEEAKAISDMSAQATEAKATADSLIAEKGFTKETEDARLKAGAARVTLEKYMAQKKALANHKTIGQTLTTNPIKNVTHILAATKGLVASLASHAPLKHGFPALFEDPKNWLSNYVTQFSYAAKEVGGKDVMSAIRAEGYSRENSINGIYDKWIPGELSKANEEYHSLAPGKIPVLGRLYKGSKTMFDGFNLKMRMDLVDHYVNIVKGMGLDPLDPETAKAWGKLAIDQTGGKTTNPDALANNFLFSQRLLKAQANNLTAHLFDPAATTAVKVQSAKTLAKMILGVGALITTANAISPGIAEFDPRSSNFGKIKIGDTRFNIGGGYDSIVTLGARVASALSGKNAIKSSSTGAFSKVGSGFGQTSFAELMGDFLQGRASPAGQVVSDLANQKTFAGGKPTVGSEVGALTTPIPIQSYSQLKNDPKSANTVATMIAQQLGVLSNTYGSATNWSTSTSKELTQFKQQVGTKEFTQANQDYNTKYGQWLDSTLKSSYYKQMSPTAQQNLISNAKTQIKNAVLEQHGFTYVPAKTPSNDTFLRKMLQPQQ
jgi:hypothetical protein